MKNSWESKRCCTHSHHYWGSSTFEPHFWKLSPPLKLTICTVCTWNHKGAYDLWPFIKRTVCTSSVTGNVNLLSSLPSSGGFWHIFATTGFLYCRLKTFTVWTRSTSTCDLRLFLLSPSPLLSFSDQCSGFSGALLLCTFIFHTLPVPRERLGPCVGHFFSRIVSNPVLDSFCRNFGDAQKKTFFLMGHVP